MSEIILCPACSSKVQLPAEFLDKTVQCPECKHIFVAGASSTAISATPAAAPVPPPAAAPAPAEPDAPSPRYDPSRFDDDEGDGFDAWGVSRTPHRRDRAGVVLTLGILAIVLGCGIGVVLGPIAWFIGSADLRAIDRGEMDGQNRSMVQAGRIIGAVGFGLGLFQLFCGGLYFGWIISMMR